MIQKLFGNKALREPLAAGTQKILSLTLLVLVGFFWFVITAGEAEFRTVSPTVLPSPLEVLAGVKSFLLERKLHLAVGATLMRVVLGFALAALVAVPLAVYAASQRWLENFLHPMMVGLRNVPIAALIPITVLWFGIGEQQKILFIFIACLPFVFSDALNAVLNVPERYVDTARTLGASDWQIVTKVLIPLALPSIFSGLRGLFGLAFGYIMLVESIKSESGLGSLINISQRLGMYEHVYLTLLLIVLLAWLIDRGLLMLQNRLFAYKAL